MDKRNLSAPEILYAVMGRSGPIGRNLTLEQAQALAKVSHADIVAMSSLSYVESLR